MREFEMKYVKILIAVFALLLALSVSATAPSVAVISPNGGENIRGVYAIDFNVSDADNNALLANIYYSATAGAHTTLLIAALNLEGASCTDSDNNNVTQNSCRYLWNTAALNGTYYIDVNVYDAADWAEDSSNAPFIVDNTAPVLSTFTPANWAYTNNATQPISTSFSDSGASPSGINPDSIIFTSTNWRATYSEGQIMTGLVGINAYIGQNMSARLVDVVIAGPPVNFEAVFEVRDESGNVVDTNTVASGSFLDNYIVDENGFAVINSAVWIEGISINQQTMIGDANIAIGNVMYDINSAELAYSGSASAGTITLAPSHPLRWDIAHIINANFSASDLAGNAATPVSWQFRIEQEKPTISLEMPANGTYVADENQLISVALADAISGMDVNRLSMRVNASTYTLYSTALSYAGTLNNAVLTFTPPTPLPEGTVSVSVTAYDRAGNTSTKNWSFILDKTPPLVSQISLPDKSYTNDVNQDINFVITDNLSGVNFPSMRLSVEDANYTTASLQVAYNSATGFVRFVPSAPFTDGQVVNVVVTVDDNVSNSKVYDWNFTIDLIAANAIIDLDAVLNKYAQVDLNWSRPTYAIAPVDYYRIYRATVPIYESGKGSPLVSRIAPRGYTDSTVEIGKTYYYRVTSVDRAGNESLLSNQERVTVQGNVMLVFDRNEVALEPGETISVKITVKNYLKEKQCITLKPWVADYNKLKASILANKFCLSQGESTELGMDITTYANSTPGYYLVEVEMKYGGEAKQHYVGVRILGNEDIDFVVPTEPVIFEIGGYEKYIEGITVRNNTNSMQEVTLTAESEIFIPAFEPNVIRLGAGEQREVRLKLNTNYTTQTGDYNIPVFARTSRYYVERAITVVLAEPSPEGDALSITGPGTCTSVSKSGTSRIYFTVTNNLNETQTVRLSAVSDIIADVNAMEVTIAPYDTYSAYVTLRGRETDRNGTHDVNIYAWSAKGEAEVRVCANIGKLHRIELKVPQEAGTARACSAQDIEVFEAEVINSGDYRETVYLSAENPYSTIGINISEDSVILNPGESAKVYIAVTPSYDTPLGTKTVYLIARTSRTSTSSQSMRITLGGFSEDVNESTIRLASGGQTYSTTSTRLDYNAATGELVFRPTKIYDENDTVAVELTFKDAARNEYVLQFDYDVGAKTMEGLRMVLDIDANYTSSPIDSGTIEFTFGDETYDIADSELSFSSGNNAITFDASRDYANAEGKTVMLRFSDTNGNDYEISMELNTDFDIGPSAIARQPLVFNVVEPSTGLEEGVLEIVNFPQNITLEQGSSGLVSVTLVNKSGKEIKNVRVKLWGLNANVYFPTLYVASIAPGESVEKTGTIAIAENASTDTIIITLEAKSDEFIGTREVALTIAKKTVPEGETPPVAQQDIYSGLVGLIAGLPGGAVAIGLIVLIILALAVILRGVGKGGKEEPLVNGTNGVRG